MCSSLPDSIGPIPLLSLSRFGFKKNVLLFFVFLKIVCYG